MSSEETKKEEENKEIIDKDTLIYIGVGTGLLGLAGVLAMAGMGWMKEQDQQKKRMAMLERQKQEMLMRQRYRPPPPQQEGWPNPIPRNTIPQSGVMELPSTERIDEQEQFIGRGAPPPAAYNTDQQRFLVSDDVLQQTSPVNNYPVIDPNMPNQQIGNKISRVMNLDEQQQQYQAPPPPMIQQKIGDDEDISDLF